MASSSNLNTNAWVQLAKKKHFVLEEYDSYQFIVTSQFVSTGFNEVIKDKEKANRILKDEELLSLLFGVAYALNSVHEAYVNVVRYRKLLTVLEDICYRPQRFLSDQETFTQNFVSLVNNDKDLLEVFTEFSQLATDSEVVRGSKKGKVTYFHSKIFNKNFSSSLTLEEDLEAGVFSYLKQNPKYKGYVGEKVDIKQQKSVLGSYMGEFDH